MKTRRGYTLLELLIVLAILTAFVAVAWPSLRSPWGRTRIEEAGHMIRAALGRVRVEAIESATPYQFRFRPGTGTYEYGPASSAKPDAGGSGSDRQATVAAFDPDAADSDETNPEDLAVEEDLPEGVRFADPDSLESETAGSVTLSPVPAAYSGEFHAGSGIGSEADWSAPVIFYPNGRSMSARFRLVSAEGRVVEVVLRGLTGTAKVGKSSLIEPEEGRDGLQDAKDGAYEPRNKPADVSNTNTVQSEE